jgi:hypothetical protein
VTVCFSVARGVEASRLEQMEIMGEEVVVEVVPSSRGLKVRPWAVEEEVVVEVVPSSRGLRVRPWAVELLMLEDEEGHASTLKRS